jgi:flagellar hook-length control protein FliK
MIAQAPSPASAPAPRVAAAPDVSGPDVLGGAAGAFAILLAGLLPAPPLMLANAALTGLDSSDLGAAAASPNSAVAAAPGAMGQATARPVQPATTGLKLAPGLALPAPAGTTPTPAAPPGAPLAAATAPGPEKRSGSDGASPPGQPSPRPAPAALVGGAPPPAPPPSSPAQGGTLQPAARVIAPAELPAHPPESAAVAAAGSPNLPPPASAHSLVPMPGRPAAPGATATTEAGPKPASSKPDAGAVRSQNPRAAGPAQSPIAPRQGAGDATTTTRPGGPSGEPFVAPTRSSPPPPALQLGLQIAAAAPHRVERMVVQLEPPDLGRVEVRLAFSRDNHVSAQIAADRPETLAVLQRDSHALERGLQQAGLQLDNKGLNFSLRQEQRQQEQGAATQTPPRFDPASPGSERDWSEAQPVRWFTAERVLDLRI